MGSFPIVRRFVRNESNVREPIPPLQLGADGPESLCLLLREGGMPYQNSIVSQPIKRDAGRNNRIAILDEHVLGSRKDHADFSILLADILYVISYERLRRALADFRLVVRIEQHRSVGVGRRNMWNTMNKPRPPVDWTHGHRLIRLFQILFQQSHSQRRFTIAILQDDMPSGDLCTAIAWDESATFRAYVGQPGGIRRHRHLVQHIALNGE